MTKKLLAVLLIGVSIMSVGCSSEAIGSEEEVDQPLEKTIVTSDPSSTKETKIGTGTFYVGEDVAAGRYVCTTRGDGNLSIYDGQVAVVDEIIDYTNPAGVTSVTLDLYEGQKIEVSGLNELILTPAQTLVKTSLSTGNWTVGVDIQPGKYICEPVKGGLLEGKGSLLVYDSEIQVANELLDASGELGVKSVVMELKDGQTVSISGLPEVKFTEN